MNKDNILAVADAIEKHSIPELGFNMRYWRETKKADKYGTRCGTVACIGGWAETVLKTDDIIEAFGMEDAQYFELCLPGTFTSRGTITPTQAVRVLRHLAETGIVDWSKADVA